MHGGEKGMDMIEVNGDEFPTSALLAAFLQDSQRPLQVTFQPPTAAPLKSSTIMRSDRGDTCSSDRYPRPPSWPLGAGSRESTASVVSSCWWEDEEESEDTDTDIFEPPPEPCSSQNPPPPPSTLTVISEAPPSLDADQVAAALLKFYSQHDPNKLETSPHIVSNLTAALQSGDLDLVTLDQMLEDRYNTSTGLGAASISAVGSLPELAKVPPPGSPDGSPPRWPQPPPEPELPPPSTPEVVADCMHVEVLRARGLRPEDRLTGKSDPYCVITLLGNSAGTSKGGTGVATSHPEHKTRVIKSSLDPVWADEKFVFVDKSFSSGSSNEDTLTPMLNDVLRVCVYDKDLLSSDFLGQVSGVISSFRCRIMVALDSRPHAFAA